MKEVLTFNKQTLFIALMSAIMMFTVGCSSVQQTQNNAENVNTSEGQTTSNNVVQEEDAENEAEIDTSNWKTYSNTLYNYSIRYPNNWVYEESENKKVVSFGTPESKTGGYIWAINIEDPDEVESLISQTGNQFEDRKESRKVINTANNIEGLLVTVTTDKNKNWFSEQLYINTNNTVFRLGNGAKKDINFKGFYDSFLLNK